MQLDDSRSSRPSQDMPQWVAEYRAHAESLYQDLYDLVQRPLDENTKAEQRQIEYMLKIVLRELEDAEMGCLEDPTSLAMYQPDSSARQAAAQQGPLPDAAPGSAQPAAPAAAAAASNEADHDSSVEPGYGQIVQTSIQEPEEPVRKEGKKRSRKGAGSRKRHNNLRVVRKLAQLAAEAAAGPAELAATNQAASGADRDTDSTVMAPAADLPTSEPCMHEMDDVQPEESETAAATAAAAADEEEAKKLLRTMLEDPFWPDQPPNSCKELPPQAAAAPPAIQQPKHTPIIFSLGPSPAAAAAATTEGEEEDDFEGDEEAERLVLSILDEDHTHCQPTNGLRSSWTAAGSEQQYTYSNVIAGFAASGAVSRGGFNSSAPRFQLGGQQFGNSRSQLPRTGDLPAGFAETEAASKAYSISCSSRSSDYDSSGAAGERGYVAAYNPAFELVEGQQRQQAAGAAWRAAGPPKLPARAMPSAPRDAADISSVDALYAEAKECHASAQMLEDIAQDMLRAGNTAGFREVIDMACERRRRASGIFDQVQRLACSANYNRSSFWEGDLHGLTVPRAMMQFEQQFRPCY